MHQETPSHTRSIKGTRCLFLARIALGLVLVSGVISYCLYLQFRINLLTQKQNLLFDCLSAPGGRWSRDKTRIEMEARGYVRSTNQEEADQDTFYIPKGDPAALSVHWIRGFVRYENNIAVSAGVESFISAL